MKIDLKSAFNPLRVASRDEWKSAFRTNKGLFEYLVMLFGLTNAPAVFQGFIQWVLHEHLGIFCVVYLDDILIFSHSQHEHDCHVHKVLHALHKHGLLALVDKCEFDKEALEYLGFIIGKDGIAMHPKKLNMIESWPVPKSVKEVQSFLGFANFYRWFISHYSEIITPLIKSTKKSDSISFPLTGVPLESFLKLKKAFTSTPLLAHHNPSLPIFLFTDASDFTISGIPHQQDVNGKLHPLAYYSRKLSKSKINYSIHDKEMLAIMESLREFRPWLAGSEVPISIISDHKNLEYFMTLQQLNHRQVRWSLELSEFNFKLSYALGKDKPMDVPLCHPELVPVDADVAKEVNWQMLLGPEHTDRLWMEPRSTEDWKEALARDDTWREAIHSRRKDWGVLDSSPLFRNKFYVPPDLRSCILFERHDSLLAGHPGHAKTLSLVCRDYNWPQISMDVRQYVRSCNTCQRSKPNHHAPYGMLVPLKITEKNWYEISMDFITDLPLSHSFDSILVVVDRLSKQAHFVPTHKSLNTPGLAQLFITNVFKLHGFPSSIVSDRGSMFVSEFWKALMAQLQVHLNLSTAYHLQTDGQTERVNQILEQYLRVYCSYKQDDWVEFLGMAEFQYNNSYHDATQTSPFFANYGFHPTFASVPGSHVQNPAASTFASHLDSKKEDLQAELELVQETAKRHYDSKWTPSPVFRPGDYVMLLHCNIQSSRPTGKLDYWKIGPFKIL